MHGLNHIICINIKVDAIYDRFLIDSLDKLYPPNLHPNLVAISFHTIWWIFSRTHLGFLLMPIVRMIRHPLQGLDLNRFLPARASHRSVDYEELAKRLDVVDKMLSRALRQTHRESFISK